MNDKIYKIGRRNFRIRKIDLATWRLINEFIKTVKIEQFFTINKETGEINVKVQELVEYLALGGNIESFLSLILQPVPSGHGPAATGLITFLNRIYCRLFAKNIFRHIEDTVLLEVAADFFTGKLSLIKTSMINFLMYLQRLQEQATKSKASPV